MDIKAYWQAVLRQDAPAIREYFWEDAYICWHNTDERFTVEEFIRANCEYPGQWDGEVKRLVQDGDQIAVAVRVWTEDGASSFHAVSYLTVRQGKICAIDEYWGEDGEPPQWRKEKQIGTPIGAGYGDEK